MDEEMHLQQEILSHKIPPDKDVSTQGEIENGELAKDRIRAKSDKNVSFKEMLITPYSKTIDQQTTPRTNLEEDMIIDEPPGSEKTNTDSMTNTYEGMEDEEGIHLTEEEKQRIYKPWLYSIIIKVYGKKMSHLYLKKKLSVLWRVSEEIILIDLGYDYYIVKFYKEENLQKTLQQGPWFINDFFLSVKHWHPNFVASEAKETKSTIWIRLSELPTKFYDHSILASIGKNLASLLRQMYAHQRP
ncbi:hypothetical protein KY290_033226 [Solanum tuberosum]|uniref:DUF4283 domain-containing protein n=1 Tax=Solanum tuberosum TaxID=4113 RepID=A0ABQ7U156_SOLTU|nr:hypothetical protein KY285_032483 [Solanum tuberosum]KAH0740183.1 hypothetical protein KY290_033226 [Solanum tuberosum]